MAAPLAYYYIHPLALESHRFLKSLELYGDEYRQIDPTLCDLLKDIVVGIDVFLSRFPQRIVASEKTKLVPRDELGKIQRIYHCTSCSRDLGKTADKAALHLAQLHREQANNERKEKKREEKKRRDTVPVKMPKKAKAIMMNDLNSFFADNLKVAEKLKHIPEYDVIENSLSAMLKKAFPDKSIKLYKFGSRITGIGTRNSDLDIYIDIGGQFNVFEQRASEETLSNFDRIFEIVKKSKIDWHNVRPVRGARVPIIRVTNAQTHIECDIGFSNSLSYFNTQLLQYIFQQQPIARRLCIFMKKWLERTKLNERITTYCMSLMVIYYLQVKQLLPSIQTLQQKILGAAKVGPWIGNYNQIPLTELNISVASVSLHHCKQHIKEFCQFYARFKYDKHVVSPYVGCVDIEIKNIENMMPERYTNFVKNSPCPKDYGLKLSSLMVVQDPLQLNHNVAARVTKTDMKQWKDYLAQSAIIIAEFK